MRVINDQYDLSGPCDNLFTGESEDYGIIINDGAIPIELVSFSGEQENKSVELIWETASERNNEFFTLEYSKDGIVFDDLANLKAFGTSSMSRDYKYVHKKPFTGINYYRLSQTDFDGLRKVHNVIAINYLIDEFSLYILPNPIENDILNLSCQSNQSTNVDYEIIDVNGKVIVRNNFTAQKGTDNYRLKLQGIKSGIYYLRFKQGQSISSQRFIKIK